VAVGFGSLNTVALIFWAWLFRAKTLIHEQNVDLGRANKLLAKVADKVAVSFAQTRMSLNIDAQRIVLTGNPLRNELLPVDRQKALDFFEFKTNKTTLLIMGGSQGSHRLNTVCSEFFCAYPQKDNLQLIHVCGLADFSWLKEKYTAAGLTCKLFDFLPQMQYAYSVADLVLCRAGATTIAELQRFQIPAILVPYPFAYAHQSANACVLAQQGAAVVIQDQLLTLKTLAAEFKQCLEDPQELAKMRQAYAGFKLQDATRLLAQEVLSFRLTDD
jgi:UDP-N-acetylglucosamine--N-acetylmuramyl-(pentapeptide) pyrophosphoryl-undecaprenol N-acetylglucosamine transferase